MGEYVSDDILDQNFMDTFWAFHFPQMILGSCRVDARDRFVMAPSVLQRMYTVALALVSMALSKPFLDLQTAEYYLYPQLYQMSVVNWLLLYLSYIGNTIHVRFFNRESNVNFYLKMQKIDRIMNISEDLNYMLRRLNNISVLFHLAIMIVLFFITANGGITIALSYTSAMLLNFPFALEITNCNNLIGYFFLRVRFINSVIKNHVRPKKYANVKNNIVPTRSYMRRLAAKSHDFVSSPTDYYLKEIFDCFTIYQDLYKFQVFVFFFNMVIFGVITFELGILSMKIGLKATVGIVNVTVMIIIIMLHAIFMCVRYEVFFREVTETKRLSIAVLALYYEGPLRTKAKNMFKTIEDSPPRFSVYDMWELDARIIIRIFNIFNTIFVALIQFAFV